MHPNGFDLSGRVALVTGGSKGLGKAMARALLEAGADVVISSRSKAELTEALDQILAGSDRRGDYVVADLTQRSQVELLAARTLEKMGRLDILVNNAGSNIPAAIDEITDEDWDHLIQLNLTSCMALSRALVPQMKERQWGRIIHIASIMGLGSTPTRNIYSASKAGLIGLTRSMALDLGPFNITVNAIAPGPILTDLPRRLLSAAQRDTFARRTALGRWGRADEMAGPIQLLASEAGSYITGTTIVVDGGAMCRAL